jgi:hypothetical protein
LQQLLRSNGIHTQPTTASAPDSESFTFTMPFHWAGMQPRPSVTPTQEQINAATRSTTFNNIVSPQHDTCPIQQELFQDNDAIVVIRQCGHYFRRDPLMQWFQRSSQCPVCRYDIRTYGSSSAAPSNTDPVLFATETDALQSAHTMLNQRDSSIPSDPSSAPVTAHIPEPVPLITTSLNPYTMYSQLAPSNPLFGSQLISEWHSVSIEPDETTPNRSL